MKFVFSLGLLVLYMNVCCSKIIPIPGVFVHRREGEPDWGECFRNTEIMCTSAGMRVQYDAENCVDCICDGEDKGVTCCMEVPFPRVCHPQYCDVWLNTTTCVYNRIRTPTTAPSGRVKMWHQACILEGWEIAKLSDTEKKFWKPDDPGPISSSKSNSKPSKP